MWQVSNSGGSSPIWSHDGHTLLYQAGDQLMAVNYAIKGYTFENEKPSVWIAKLGGSSPTLSPDGKRVAGLTPAGTPPATAQEHEVVFLENIFDELRRKVR